MENITLTSLLKQAAEKFPTNRAVSVSGKFDLTHSKLQHLIDEAASHLVSSGVKPGDVVALTYPNTVEVYIYNIHTLFLYALQITRQYKITNVLLL